VAEEFRKRPDPDLTMSARRFRIVDMRRAISIVLAPLLALAVATAAWADCTAEQNPHAQMKCCAAMHHECGKSANPNDCCKQMRGAGASAAVSTAAVPSIKVPVVHGVIERIAAAAASVIAPSMTPSSLEFTRPHDPPHLHPFALLI
jgi:hypothetical protein